jgi:hypothetical protein
MNKIIFITHALALACILIVIRGHDYTTDWGNGIITVADKYVASGEWVYDCKKVLLISRSPRIFPEKFFINNGKLDIGTMFLRPEIRTVAERIIEEVTKTPEWYRNLKYTRSTLDEYSNIARHYFGTTIDHHHIQWTINVAQPDELGYENTYYISAEPNNPERHKPHNEWLQTAKKSCPKPQ